MTSNATIPSEVPVIEKQAAATEASPSHQPNTAPSPSTSELAEPEPQHTQQQADTTVPKKTRKAIPRKPQASTNPMHSSAYPADHEGPHAAEGNHTSRPVSRVRGKQRPQVERKPFDSQQEKAFPSRRRPFKQSDDEAIRPGLHRKAMVGPRRAQAPAQVIPYEAKSDGDAKQSKALALKLTLNLEIEITLKASIHGDITLELL